MKKENNTKKLAIMRVIELELEMIRDMNKQLSKELEQMNFYYHTLENGYERNFANCMVLYLENENLQKENSELDLYNKELALITNLKM